MKANLDKAKQSALDLLNTINELKELLPKLRNEYNQLEERMTTIEERINNGKAEN